MIRAWGSDLKGRVVHLISLVSDDLRANISTYGAVLQDLRCNDLPHSLVLGFPNLQPYLTNPPYLGAIVGRYANRIAKARIDGATDHQHLDANQDGLHCLHGGSDGSSSRLWAIIDSGSDFVTLEDIIPDGHMGFVGTLRVNVRYQLAQSNLKIDITATSDAASLCNFSLVFKLKLYPEIDFIVIPFFETFFTLMVSPIESRQSPSISNPHEILATEPGQKTSIAFIYLLF